MSEYTILDFDIHSQAEAARMMLADHGIDWKEETYSYNAWLVKDQKKTCVFRKLPGLKDGDFEVYQSNAIVRYLARSYYHYGQDNPEAARIDMVVDGVEDLRRKYMNLVLHDSEVGKAAYLQKLPKDLRYFERILSKSRDEEFVVGDRISLADYCLLDILLVHLILSAQTCLKDFPLLRSYVDCISARPNLKAYLESDAHKSRPVNASGDW